MALKAILIYAIRNGFVRVRVFLFEITDSNSDVLASYFSFFLEQIKLK